ncbi:MAG TPA: alternative ribosome rescue aminoacyl-tRNA hydrolase ArfB [Candidatus Limnocylindrales bacterium]|nr:alternative ribosome rescue aminoacyl-tRNA hydrolase ArfB [Candidatus Limnocylindrales bacterium]
MIHVAPGISICEAELGVSYVRSSGPGGQNVNKTSTKAVVRWNVRASRGLRDDIKARFLARFASRITDAGDVILTSDRYRDQPRNLEDCLEKLTRMLAEVAVAPVRRRPTQPGRAARERRIHAKKQRGSLKSLRGRIDND